MKILVAQIVGLGSFSRGIMPDVTQTLIDKYPHAEIFHLTCSNTFKTCYVNQKGDPEICYRCKVGVRKSLNLIKGNFKHVILEDLITEEDKIIGKDFIENSQISDKEVLFENYEVIESSLSSYISLSRDRDLLNIKNSRYKELVHNGISVFVALDRFVEKEKIDLVYNFNGRHTYHRAIMAVSKKHQIPFYNMEVARPGGYLEKYPNVLPHNISARQKLIENAWNNSNLPLDQKIKIGSSYFEKKVSGERLNDKVYTNNQNKNELPDNINWNNETDVLFTSSDDEFAAVGKELYNPYFKDQNEGVHFVALLYGEKFKNKNLVVRMHPNLKGIKYEYVQYLKKLNGKFPNVIVLPPESTVDSYALLRIAQKVIVFGSTVGVEANFWKKPVVLLGKSLYYNLDVAYKPDNKEEIISFLKKELKPKGNIDSIKYGFYYLTGGEKSKYFTSTKNQTVYFKGKVMYSFSFLERVISKTIQVVYRITGLRIFVRR